MEEYILNLSNTVVIKAKYGDTLRRFRVRNVNQELDLSFDGLKEKILSLFLFTPDTELMLTYIDRDRDEVTLADDEGLRDAVMQGLNPLRITVEKKWSSSFSLFNWKFYSFGISSAAAIFIYSFGIC